MKANSPNVLITGVAGFIGRHAARHFASRGWQVIGVDAAAPENAPQENLASYYVMKLPDGEFDEVLRRHQPAACIHCAGRASVGLSMSEPLLDYFAGPAMTCAILNSIRCHAVTCRFVLLSSAAVYGNPTVLPVHESHEPAPISPYGFHKWQSEILCREFSLIYGVPTASARVFSAYGPGLRRQVVWDICRKAIFNDTLILNGSGNESRDFVYVGDIVRGLEIVVSSAPMDGEVYNLASGRETTIKQLADVVLNELGIESSVTYDQRPQPGVPSNWRANIDRLAGLGYAPAVTLDDGIKATVAWNQADMRLG